MADPQMSSENVEAERVEELQEMFAAFNHAEPSKEKLQPMSELLGSYSNIKPEDVLSHVLSVKQKAWNKDPYPCIGQFNFLDLSIADSPIYNDVLARIKSGQGLVDLGCCFGQDIRKLVSDGAPSENLVGCDINKQFFELGYDLFLDKKSLNTTFLTANILEEKSSLDALDGHVQIVHAASFLHLFDREDQKIAIRRIFRLFKNKSGVLCFGRQVGNSDPGYVAMGSGKGIYMHNGESFKEVWAEVALERGENWRVTANLDTSDTLGKPKDGKTGKLVFRAERE